MAVLVIASRYPPIATATCFASSSSPISTTTFVSCRKFLSRDPVYFAVCRQKSHFISLACSTETSQSPPPEISSSNDRVLKFLQNHSNFSSIVLVPRHLPNPVKQFSELPLADQAYYVLVSIAFMMCGAMIALLASTIPTLNAMKRAALSLEKLADAAREELPATMAAIRLSGMEISDLTLELSDLSEEISESVRSSARAVHAAEVGIRRMGSFAASQTLSMIQEHASAPVEAVKPVVANAAETTWQAVTQAQKVVFGLAALPGLSKWIQKKNMEEQQKIEEDTVSDTNDDPVAKESSNEQPEVSV